MTTHEEIMSLLESATFEELSQIANALDRWPRPTGVGVSLLLARATPSRRGDLEVDIARELERCASAPMTRIARRAARLPARDDLHEAVTETAMRLGVKVRVPIAGTLRGRLAALSGALVDRAVHAMSPEEQQRHGKGALDRISPRTNAAEVAGAIAVPALHGALGPAVLGQLVEGIMLQATALVVGRAAARALMRSAIGKMPMLVAASGPLAWGASSAMLVYEVQKPAYRKLVPALVCLGFVALRSRPT